MTLSTYADYAAAKVLPALCKYQGRRSSVIRELAGLEISDRQMYNYLAALAQAGKVKRRERGKLWWAV